VVFCLQSPQHVLCTPRATFGGFTTTCDTHCRSANLTHKVRDCALSTYCASASSNSPSTAVSVCPDRRIPCFSIRYISALRLMSRYLAVCV
jgi:hypothetical protein